MREYQEQEPDDFIVPDRWFVFNAIHDHANPENCSRQHDGEEDKKHDHRKEREEHQGKKLNRLYLVHARLLF